MKKCAVSILALLMVFSFSWSAFGQRVNRGPGLEAREDPSLDRSRGGRGGQRGFRGGPPGFLDVESTNQSIKMIEEQLTAIKKALEGIEPPASPPQPDVDFRAMMEKMRERTEIIQKAAAAIDEQVLVLKGRQAAREFEESIDELEPVVDSAKEEKAEKTAQLMQGIIDARRKAFQETAERLGIPIRGRRGGPRGGPGGMMGGPGGMRMERGQ